MYALWICQQNIERFGERLAVEPDIHMRDILAALITREAAKLEQLKSEIQAERRAGSLVNLNSRRA